jgi:6-pyruvoyltetrahydropterin/6-carboxytetrahydropterin synthase
MEVWYRVRVEGSFDAAHFIYNYPGKCKELHGHTWKVEAFFVTNELEEESRISIDFKELKDELKRYLDENLDHKNLGAMSAERIAEMIYLHFQHLGYPVEKVRVWEGNDKYVEVFEKGLE